MSAHRGRGRTWLPAGVPVYWRAYGGWRELCRSSYLHLALLLTCVMAPTWMNPDWWDHVIQVMPNILGFSLAGYALWQGMGNERFRDAMAGQNDDGSPSPFIVVNAAFVHFIVVQVLALMVALLASAYDFSTGTQSSVGSLLNQLTPGISALATCIRLGIGAVGYLLFLYALVLAFAATFAVFSTARWFDDQRARERQDPKP